MSTHENVKRRMIVVQIAAQIGASQ